jgi:hypothetical protein
MQETADQMHDRLRAVIAASRFEAFAEPYTWQSVSKLSQLPDNALAVVKDGASWYALTESSPDVEGSYRIFAFHFAEGTNATGFVAWLAGLMKKEAATGAMVVCGFDARATAAQWRTSYGLFDYWGCPWAKGDEVIELVERLRREGR